MPATFDDLYEARFQKVSNANIGALRIVTQLPRSPVRNLCQEPEARLQWINESSKEVRLLSSTLY